jgi:hypothetical protein
LFRVDVLEHVFEDALVAVQFDDRSLCTLRKAADDEEKESKQS